MERERGLLRAWITVGLFGLSALACTAEPLSKRVGPGATVGIALNGIREGLTVGFGSGVAGEDPQRGRIEFVLCKTNIPGCNADPAISPRQGYRMDTNLITRAQVDVAAPLRGARIEGGVFGVPRSGPHVPPAGVYRVEPRLFLPGATTGVALLDPGSIRTIEITSEPSPPTPLHDPGEFLQRGNLQSSVPLPALHVGQGFLPEDGPAAAADVWIDFPADRVKIVAAVPTPSASLVKLVPVDQDTVRVLFVRDASMPPVDELGLEQTFELVFELLPGATPVTAADFPIRSTGYTAEGAPIASERFGLATIL